MVEFMADKIMDQAEISLEKGQDKYRAYFVKTKLYKKYREGVDTILTVEGYEECIVTE